MRGETATIKWSRSACPPSHMYPYHKLTIRQIWGLFKLKHFRYPDLPHKAESTQCPKSDWGKTSVCVYFLFIFFCIRHGHIERWILSLQHMLLLTWLVLCYSTATHSHSHHQEKGIQLQCTLLHVHSHVYTISFAHFLIQAHQY